MRGFYVTYDIVTHESAEHGDAAERGFVSPGGWHSDDRPEPMTLREALDLMGCCEDSGNWFTETDGRQNYSTGEVETRSLHCPRSISAASYDRVALMLGARRRG